MTVNLPQGNRKQSAGDILKVGWSLYTSNFSQFSKIALIATLWSLVPTAFNMLTTSALGASGQPPSPGIRVLVFVVWLALTIFCAAQALGWFAGISRLAYQSLQRIEPETPSEDSVETNEQALRFTRSRRFSFLGASLLQTLFLFLASIAIWIVATIFVVVVSLIVGFVAGGESPMFAVVLLLAVLLCFAFTIYAYLYVFARLMLTEKPLAIEQSSGAFETVERSWQLTKHSPRKAMLVAAALFLLGLVIYLVPSSIAIAQVPPEVFQILQTEDPTPAQLEQFAQALQPFFIKLFFIGTIINVFFMPLFKTTLTALYADLRDRTAT